MLLYFLHLLNFRTPSSPPPPSPSCAWVPVELALYVVMVPVPTRIYLTSLTRCHQYYEFHLPGVCSPYYYYSLVNDYIKADVLEYLTKHCTWFWKAGSLQNILIDVMGYLFTVAGRMGIFKWLCCLIFYRLLRIQPSIGDCACLEIVQHSVALSYSLHTGLYWRLCFK